MGDVTLKSDGLTILVQRIDTLSDAARAAVDHVCMAARPGEEIGSLFQFC